MDEMTKERVHYPLEWWLRQRQNQDAEPRRQAGGGGQHGVSGRQLPGLSWLGIRIPLPGSCPHACLLPAALPALASLSDGRLAAVLFEGARGAVMRLGCGCRG